MNNDTIAYNLDLYIDIISSGKDEIDLSIIILIQ